MAPKHVSGQKATGADAMIFFQHLRKSRRDAPGRLDLAIT